LEETDVTKPNLGKKRTCQSCEARFFDLSKNPIICPKCGETYKIPVAKARKTPPPDKKDTNVNAAEIDQLAEDPKVETLTNELDVSDSENENDELAAELDDDLDDSLMENTSELDENDGIAEVFEHVSDNDTEK
jgi:uncharacterized protein (TIGR02300 family)